MKRTIAQTGAKGAAKKAKQDPIDASLAAVSAALTQAEGLSEGAAQMLCNALPSCLGVPQDARHKYQEGLTDLVGEELSGIETGMQRAIAEAQEAAQLAEAQKASCETVVTEAKASLEAQQAVVQSSKVKLADDALGFRAARQALQEAELQQITQSKEIDQADTTKGNLESLLQAMETVHERPEEVEKLVKGIMGHLNPDDSMKTAMPSALCKAPDARGPFDLMVFDQLRESGATQLKALSEKVEAGAPLKASLADAVRSASAALDAAKQAQVTSANTFIEEQAKLTAAQEALSAAQATFKEANAKAKKAVRHRDSAEAELDLFRQDTLSAFTFLKERTTPVPEVEMAPAPEAAEAAGAKVVEPAQAALGPQEISCAGA